MRVLLLVALVACGGGAKGIENPKKMKRSPDPGGGGSLHQNADDDGDDDGEPSGGKRCPPGYSRSGTDCVPTPTGIRNKCNPNDPMGTACEGGSQGWPDGNGATVVGAIPKDSIHKVVRENFATIRQCYEEVLLANPGVEGRVMVKMTVGIDGAVTDAAATGVHPALETCVAEKIRKFRFPRPDTGSSVEITYPFVFKAG